MAEVGGTSTLKQEVITAVPDALAALEGNKSSIGRTASDTLSGVKLTTDHPRVTLTTMIAPSHDWFVGVSGMPLLNAPG